MSSLCSPSFIMNGKRKNSTPACSISSLGKSQQESRMRLQRILLCMAVPFYASGHVYLYSSPRPRVSMTMELRFSNRLRSMPQGYSCGLWKRLIESSSLDSCSWQRARPARALMSTSSTWPFVTSRLRSVSNLWPSSNLRRRAASSGSTMTASSGTPSLTSKMRSPENLPSPS